MVNGSVTPVRPPDSNTAAPDAIAVEPRDDPLSPSAVLLLIAMTPAETVVSPVYVLAFDNVNVLLDDVFFVSVPVPEMIPDSV
jgi:hypothetical protein